MKHHRHLYLLFIFLLLLTTATAQRLQSAGQVVVSAPVSTVHQLTSLAWQDVPGWKGAVTLPRGGHLAVTVSGEVRAAGTNPQVVLRALVNGTPAKPGSYLYLNGVQPFHTRTCTFNIPQLAAGPHQVRIQYAVGANTTFLLGDHTMVMRFAAYDSKVMRVMHARGPAASWSGGGLKDIPGMGLTMDLPWKARMEVTISGEFSAGGANNRIFVRPIVDGKSTSPIDAIIGTGPLPGVQSFTFVTPPIDAGKRSLKVMWQGDGAQSVKEPMVTVTAVPDGINWNTGVLHQGLEPTITRMTSSSWTDVPGLGGRFWQPAPGDLALRFCGEIKFFGSGKRVFLRALVDGKPALTTDVVFNQDPVNLYQTREALFVLHRLGRGWRDIKIQWSVDSGGDAYLGDRTLSATAAPGQTPLLVVAMESDRGQANYPYGGLFSNLVVQTVGGKRVFKPYVGDRFFRADPGVADWFAENTAEHLHLVEAAVLGPYKKKYTEYHYRTQVTNPFTTMKMEALNKADVEFDYSYYDRDNDGWVRTNELAALIVFYQDTTFGEVRSIPTLYTADGVKLDYSGWGQATAYTPDFVTAGQRGLFCHELSHLLIKAGDMYETSFTDPTAPGPFSIMDNHNYGGHLDPMHKVIQGRWFEYYDVGKEGWYTIKPVSQGGNIYRLRDKASHGGEYFLVENRQNLSYDRFLPDQGLAIWHCDESKLPDWRTAVEMEPECGAKTPIDYRNYLFGGSESGFHAKDDFWDNSASKSRWHDNTWSGIGVFAVRRIPGGDGALKAYLDIPGPGVLVQLEHPYAQPNALGEVVTRVRIVNTSKSNDAFQLAVKTTGTASWTTQYTGTMTPYQVKFFNLKVKPIASQRQASFTVDAVSVMSTGAAGSDKAEVSYPLVASGQMWPGGTVNLDCSMPHEKNRLYLMCASFGYTPGFTVPGAGHMGLNPDNLFTASWSLPGIFNNFQGVLDAQGKARATFAIPYLRALKGIDFYFAFVTYSFPDSFREVSNTVQVPVR